MASTIMKISILLALLGLASCANKTSLCQTCDCPRTIQATKNIVNCRSRGLKTMPEWDLWASDEVYLVMKFTFNDFEQITQDMIPHRKDVYQMFFDGNNISYIGPRAFCRLPELKYLSLSGNELERIKDDAFKACNDTGMQLRILDLSLNKLHSLDDDIFDDLFDLDELNLDENEFVAIDASTAVALSKLHSLTRLHLARNKLHELSSGMSTPFKTLDYLTLAGNDLQLIPKELRYAKNLVELNLNDNPILLIHDDAFKGLENLRILNMSRMSRLELIDKESFQPLKSLVEWRCSINYDLKYIHPEMFGSNRPANLATVDLSQNHLTTLDKNVLGWWKGENLNLQNNPFFCDCHMTWLKARKTDPELIKDVRCESGPADIKDERIIEVPDDAFKCDEPIAPNNQSDDYAMVAALVSIASFSIIVIAVAIFAILRTRKSANSWTSVRYTKARDGEF